MEPKPKRKRRRPPTKPQPERIEASPEALAQALLRLSANHSWEYDKKPPV